jgi:3-hydroxyisobutyrate dehydrogenase-like beta-hydroxyacid dehydrogenase
MIQEVGMRTVGFIGVGTIGLPMARNIVKGGFALTAHDLDPARVALAVEAGARGAASIAEAVADADMVITMVPDAPDVERSALGPGGVLEHIGTAAVYVDMSTIDPATTRKVGKAFADRGIAMIDSPVTRSVAQAITGNLALLVGGDPAVLGRVRPVLDCVADTITHCGPLGNGSAMKLVNNFMGAGIVALVAEAMCMGIRAGLTLETMIEASGKTGTRNGMLHGFLPQTAFRGDFRPGFFTRLSHKDVRLALAMAAAGGVDTPVGRAVHAQLDAALARYPTDDFSSLLRIREQQAGIEVRLAAGGAETVR